MTEISASALRIAFVQPVFRGKCIRTAWSEVETKSKARGQKNRSRHVNTLGQQNTFKRLFQRLRLGNQEAGTLAKRWLLLRCAL